MYLMEAAVAGVMARRRSKAGAMARLRVKFTFPQELIKEPVIYEIGKRYNVITNIRRADITAEVAWTILELDGERQEIDDALAWVAGTGIRVDPVEDSILEG